MQTGPFKLAIGSQVKDVYGRDLGRLIGYYLDFAGSVSAIGVEARSLLKEYPADRIASGGDNFIVLKPEWRLIAERLNLGRGVVEKRKVALEKMAQNGQMPRKLYEEMSKSIAAMKEKHRELGETLNRRLLELQEEDDRLEEFMAKLEVQGFSEEIGAAQVKSAMGRCLAIKAMNGAERLEMKELMSVIEAEDEDSLPADAMKATEEADDLLQQAADLLDARDSERQAGQHPVL